MCIQVPGMRGCKGCSVGCEVCSARWEGEGVISGVSGARELPLGLGRLAVLGVGDCRQEAGDVAQGRVVGTRTPTSLPPLPAPLQSLHHHVALLTPL